MFKKHKHTYVYYSVLGIMLAATYFLQTATPVFPAVFSVRPMPAFMLMLCISAYGGEAAGIISGLALGIATDVCSAVPDGTNAAVMMLMGYICSLLATYIFNSGIVPGAVLCGIFTAAYYLIYWLISVAFRGYPGVGVYLVRYSLPGAVYTWLFVFAFWPLVKKISLYGASKISRSNLLE